MVKEIPNHLKKFIVEQPSDRYTEENHATWRYTLRVLKKFLTPLAESTYARGLEESGITEERIPLISDIDLSLQKLGWRAVPVSGFIPPAAFMEFQANKILPIASDMRTLQHILYTPAPDIVHEAAGHAPILANKEFSNYLQKYAEISKKSIFSSEDLLLYSAIRELSDTKEDPTSTEKDIEQAQKKLDEAVQNMSYLSEAGKLGRMNWWTAEYGLMGSLENPKIYGAGLLSSIGESLNCLKPEIEKLPLSLDCINYDYDITKPQPQLFVARDFAHLIEVLEELAETLSYRRGGVFACEQVLKAKTLNTIELNSGIQISGCLSAYQSKEERVDYLQFSGPVQLCIENKELEDQGVKVHAQGYGTPVGAVKNLSTPLSQLTVKDIEKMGWIEGASVELSYESGVEVQGVIKKLKFHNDKLILLTFINCSVKDQEGEFLFRPAWGEFDLSVGESVKSAYARVADEVAYGVHESYEVRKVPVSRLSGYDKEKNELYKKVYQLRRSEKSLSLLEVEPLAENYLKNFSKEWLLNLELIELLQKHSHRESEPFQRLVENAKELSQSSQEISDCYERGFQVLNLKFLD